MSKQPQKAYWNKHPGEYQRHSVEKELTNFMGWKTLLHLAKVAEDEATNFSDTLAFADGLIIGFATAGRVNEWNKLQPNNFVEHDEAFEVVDMVVSKRYKKVDHVVECQRCHTNNLKFEVICTKCGANLIYGGKRKWTTTPMTMQRVPFMFPKKEPTTEFIRRRVELARSKNWTYLFLNPSTGRPISDVCFYDHFAQAGEKVGIDMWPHRQRAERCKQLVEEYDFSKDDLRRFTMIVADKTLNIYAATSKPYQRKMGIT